MKKKPAPRALEITPKTFYIELSTYRPSDPDELPEVTFRFGDTQGSTVFTAVEAERIGKWFLGLAKAIDSWE